MERDDAKRRIDAEMLAEAMLDLLATRYGIERDDIPKHLETIRWAESGRIGLMRLSWAAALGVIALAVSGIVSAIWEGVKHAIRN